MSGGGLMQAVSEFFTPGGFAAGGRGRMTGLRENLREFSGMQKANTSGRNAGGKAFQKTKAPGRKLLRARL